MDKYYKWKVLGVFLLIALVVGWRVKANYDQAMSFRQEKMDREMQKPVVAAPEKPKDKLATETDYYDAIVVKADAYVIIVDGIETQYSELDNVKLFFDVYAGQIVGKKFNIISKGNQSLARVTSIADLLKERNIEIGQVLY